MVRMSFRKCAEIQDLLDKYLEEEKNLQARLQQRKLEQEKKPINFQRISNRLSGKPKYVSNEEAKIRNQKLLKDLEVSKARFRTLTSFTPTDEELREIETIYRQSIS